MFLTVHPPLAQIAAQTSSCRSLPGEAKLSDVMLLVIAIVGTTVAPWQLFFQQSYVIDKRITPRFMPTRRLTWGSASCRDDRRGRDDGVHRRRLPGHARSFGQFTDAGGVAAGLEAMSAVPPA